MSVVIGIDEAGYGPRLGPLVIAATGWNVAADPREFDFWTRLQRVVCQQRDGVRPDARLHVADSKQVYSPSQGLAHLERSVLTFLAIAGHRPGTFHELWRTVHDGSAGEEHADACCPETDMMFPLPLAAEQAEIDSATLRLADEFEKQQVRLHTIRVDIAGVQRFNRLTRSHGSKGSTLTQLSLELAARCWQPFRGESVLVLADRHGGRRFYRGALVEALEGRLVSCLSEQADQSRYRVERSEFRFETRAERHFPVAVASMCAKYLRELTMEAFNRFWRRHVPNLKSTKGYPADAKRFRRDIAHAQQRLGIPDDVLWRIR